MHWKSAENSAFFGVQCKNSLQRQNSFLQRQTTAAVRPSQAQSGAMSAVLQRMAHDGMMPLCIDTGLTSPTEP